MGESSWTPASPNFGPQELIVTSELVANAAASSKQRAATAAAASSKQQQASAGTNLTWRSFHWHQSELPKPLAEAHFPMIICNVPTAFGAFGTGTQSPRPLFCILQSKMQQMSLV